MLQLKLRAVSMVTVAPEPQVPPLELRTTAVLSGSCRLAGFGSASVGAKAPESNAAAATSVLKVEPGKYRSPLIVRLMSGSSGSAMSWS